MSYRELYGDCSEKSSEFVLRFEVRRNRPSVSQGTATVYINGEPVITFGDDPELIHPGEEYYGPLIGGWASKTPDYAFIRGLFWHKLDDVYHHSDKPKKIIQELLSKAAPAKIMP